MSLEIDDVSKLFDGLQVLDGVTLTVPAEGLVGLIGPNGAGKSTLFSIVSGFERASRGGVRFEGRRLDGLPPEARARLGIARTFQVPRLFAHLSVRENLAVAAPDQEGERLVEVFFRGGRMRARDREVMARVDEIVDFLRLRPVAETAAGQLSGGQRKLVELGRALMTRPRLVLLDEPFAGVNPVLIEELAAHIRALFRRGIGFLIVEHNLAALTRLVERLVVMDRGRILADGAPAAVLRDPAVREAYVGGAAT
ncbi:MAG TPA: ABC transporter ATP-binding protein [Alphaproteobacteria bacterium]|nr:ABC transporter ATP-binding protein [Alphaproteobacteria bacterium]